jgi:hypothetical protein
MLNKANMKSLDYHFYKVIHFIIGANDTKNQFTFYDLSIYDYYNSHFSLKIYYILFIIIITRQQEIHETLKLTTKSQFGKCYQK